MTAWRIAFEARPVEIVFEVVVDDLLDLRLVVQAAADVAEKKDEPDRRSFIDEAVEKAAEFVPATCVGFYLCGNLGDVPGIIVLLIHLTPPPWRTP